MIDERGRRQRLGEPRLDRDERRAGHEPRPDGGEAAGETARRAAHRAARARRRRARARYRSASEPSRCSSSSSSAPRRPPSAARTSARPPTKAVETSQATSTSAPREVEAERLERAEAAVDRRRPADRDDHAAGARVERRADQLPGAGRRRAQRVVRVRPTSASPLARAISITAVSSRIPHSASTGSPSGPVTRAVRRSAAIGAEHVEGSLAAVGQRKRDAPSAPARSTPSTSACRCLARREAAAELVGAAENRAVVGHADRMSWAARSATITVGQFV